MEESDACRYRICSAIVEDEKDLIWIYKQIFTRIGVPVSFVAIDGFEAVATFRECASKPQVVLMDNRLPGLSGVDVTKEMIKAEPDTRVIFLSGDTGMREEAIKAGAFLFLEKPVGLKDIFEAIESAIAYLPVAKISTDRGTHGEIGSL
jgi:two-component system chemotaxis response regulator CheY